jgi:hypothetical protein
MFGKHQPKPTEKAREYLQAIKKTLKCKQSDELTSGKARRSPIAALSDSKDSLVQPISKPAPNKIKNKRTIVRSKDEEEALNSDAKIIEIPILKSQPVRQATSTKFSNADSDIESPAEDPEAEMSKTLHMRLRLN